MIDVLLGLIIGYVFMQNYNLWKQLHPMGTLLYIGYNAMKYNEAYLGILLKD